MRVSELTSLSGKAAIVTGGAMGIGFGIVQRFVEAGANVVIADVDPKAAEAAAKRAGDAAVAIAVDIASDAAPGQIVTKCIERFGGVDILVNNAGIFPTAPVLEMPPELFDRVLHINLRGLVLLSKAAALQMVKQGRGGRIINIGSIDSLRPSNIGLAAYDASKGGVLMFTRSLALELAAHGVLVNSILPGGITTEGTSKPLQGMTEEQTKEMLSNFVKRVPLGHMGVPEDIANAALFLASPMSSYMTGSHIVVDGGALLM